ncbi:MAG: helix-turn-helix transcriptional regulator, partial [Francisellaceae bacterium]
FKPLWLLTSKISTYQLGDEQKAAQFGTYNGLTIHQGYSLTEKEKQCLYWLLRGKNAREIAKLLFRSPRTIESHIDILKHKFDASSKTVLIDKALNSGVLSMIPHGIILEL